VSGIEFDGKFGGLIAKGFITNVFEQIKKGWKESCP
jgi:hypothetical protein